MKKRKETAKYKRESLIMMMLAVTLYRRLVKFTSDSSPRINITSICGVSFLTATLAINVYTIFFLVFTNRHAFSTTN